jgi:uncharacterized protein YndB with AHSA1/START domain
MRQVTVSIVISAPREQVFDFVADLSLRPSFTDHYLTEYRLARPDPVGLGAAARFKFDRSKNTSEWAGLEIKECERPRRIVEEGTIGRRGRSRIAAVYEFMPESGGSTRVELTTLSDPQALVDRIKQRGAAGWMKRQTRKSLERLRTILEDPENAELKRVTVAGYDDYKAPRFGAHPQGRRAEPPVPVDS